MALSLDQIFKPLSDFFINLYSSSTVGGVMFRFDKFGSVISEGDFIDPNHPELGYSANIAEEFFADLVNHVPVDAGDNMNLIFRQDAVDSSYFYRLLSPAQPCVTGDSPDNQDIITAFSNLKANALQQWTNLNLASSTGLMLEFKPSFAGPVNWYDKAAPDMWTDQKFTISAPAPTPNKPPVALNDDIWHMKVSDQVLRQAVLPEAIRTSAPVLKAVSVAQAPERIEMRPASGVPLMEPMALRPSFATVAASSAIHANPAMTPVASVSGGSATLASEHAAFVPVAGQATQLHSDASSFAIQDSIHTQMKVLAVSQRFQIAQFIGTTAPTVPVATDSITVSFSYSLVHIKRPWMIDAFLNDSSWFVPSTAKGAITSGSNGVPFSLSTIAFVTIKDLSITANWPAADIANSAEATSFGPFKVDGGIAAGSLSHKGIQIIGWLAQTLPTLPPNDPPA